MLKPWTSRFLELALEREALRFGEFTLKSGRVSPYFFNAGEFSSGQSVATLAGCYADAIVDSGIAFDLLFGPAYKGIPLVTAVALCLSRDHGLDIPFAYDRKEAKTHGEGGVTVGAPISGRVLIVDDVISAGTSVNQAIELIEDAGGRACGVAIALDREERGSDTEHSAVEEVERKGLKVVSIAGLADLIAWLKSHNRPPASLEAIMNYQRQYSTRSA